MAQRKRPTMQSAISLIYPNAAGIDIGSAAHFVAVPPDREDQSVREFASFGAPMPTAQPAPPPPSPPPRRFLCALCRSAVFICSHCDRGQRYCSAACSNQARRGAQRAAGKRYQDSRKGRLAHARRQGQWRARQQTVTHQGSPLPPCTDVLPPGETTALIPDASQRCKCQFCGRWVSNFVRLDYLRCRFRRPSKPSVWSTDSHGHLYDNLKSAVFERKGPAIRFNPTLLALSAHYRFEARPVAPARGNEKGRVERAIRHIRTAFFEGPTFDGIDDLNAQADDWVAGAASQRRCPEDTQRSVQQAFELELPHLMELPPTPFCCEEFRGVTAAKTPHVRFDLNDYSIPHWCDTST